MKNCRSRFILGSKPAIAICAINWQIQCLTSQVLMKSQHLVHHMHRSPGNCHGAVFTARFPTRGVSGEGGALPKCDTCLSFPANSFVFEQSWSSGVLCHHHWMLGKEQTGEEHLHHYILWEARSLTWEGKGRVLSKQWVISASQPEEAPVYTSKKIQEIYSPGRKTETWDSYLHSLIYLDLFFLEESFSVFSPLIYTFFLFCK